MQLIRFLIIFLLITPVFAKIGDSPPIQDGKITYRSHDNYVEAVDSKTRKLLWRTYLYKSIKPDHYKPSLEEDVQWHIVHLIKLNGSHLEAGGRNHTYWLDKKTGKIIKKF
jgi:hypothetical protein